MTEQKQYPTPVDLFFKRVDTVSVNVPDSTEKVATLCVVLEDNYDLDEENLPELLSLSEDTPYAPTLAIDDLKAVEEDQVEIILRSLTKTERLKLAAIYDDKSPFAEERIIGLLDEGSDGINDKGSDSENEQVLFFRIVLPSALLYIAHKMWTETRSAAFVLATDDYYPLPINGELPSWSDYLGIVDFPIFDIEKYNKVFKALFMAISGGKNLLELDDVTYAHKTLLDLVSRVAVGSRKAVEDVNKFVNIFNLLEDHINELGDDLTNLTSEEKNNLYLYSLTEDLYSFLSPEAFATYMSDSGIETDKIVDDIDIVDNLIKTSGLEGILEKVLKETGETTFMLPDYPKNEEIVSYYSRPISDETFPKEMKEVKDLFPNFFWDETLLTDDTTMGTQFQMFILSLAVSINRLDYIQDRTHGEVSTLSLFTQGITQHNDYYDNNSYDEPSPMWAMVAAVSLLAKEDNTAFVRIFGTNPLKSSPRQIKPTDLPFSELFDTRGDNEEPEYEGTEVEFSNLLLWVIHVLVHKIINEEWDIQVVLSELPNSSPLKKLLTNLFSTLTMDLQNPQKTLHEYFNNMGSEKCPITALVVNQLITVATPEPVDYCEDTSKVIYNLARLNVLKNTVFDVWSPEWYGYITSYLDNFFSKE